MSASLKKSMIAVALPVSFLATGLGACQDQAKAEDDTASCADCGEIESIDARKVEGEASAGAAVAGAIIGGVIGHQFGSGSGNDAATAAGAVGGAAAGHEIDQERKSHTVYDVVIDMDEGADREVTIASRDGLSPGERVRVTSDRVTPL